MAAYKRNQVEEAIFRALGAHGERAAEVKFRIKRLLVADRELAGRSYAFFSSERPGSGAEIKFSTYEAFAILVAIMVLEHGLPQVTVVKIMRQVRAALEIEHERILKRGPRVLESSPKPGGIAGINSDPVFLAMARATGSAVEKTLHPVALICRGEAALMTFIKKGSPVGVTFFELTGMMLGLATDLARTRPAKRGPAA
jgi:hypothetical protein